MANKFNLKIIEGNNVDTVFELEDGVRYEVHRMPSGGIPTDVDRKKTLFLMDSEVSKLHASLSVVAGELVVEDLNSKNGVFVNNKRVKKSLLMNNDRLKIGNTVFFVSLSDMSLTESRTFVGQASTYSKQARDFKKLAKVLDEKVVFEPALKTEPPFPPESVARNLMLELMDKVSDIKGTEPEEPVRELVKGYFFEVTILDGLKKGKKFRFYKRQIVIGKTTDLWLDDSSVSREHARVSVSSGGLFKVKDLGSQNGTFVNDSRVQMATFKEHDILKLGNTTLSFSYIDEDF